MQCACSVHACMQATPTTHQSTRSPSPVASHNSRCYSGLFRCDCGVTMSLSVPSDAASPAPPAPPAASARAHQPRSEPPRPAPATAPPQNVGPRPFDADYESFSCPTCSHIHTGYRHPFPPAPCRRTHSHAGPHWPRSSRARVLPTSASHSTPICIPDGAALDGAFVRAQISLSPPRA